MYYMMKGKKICNVGFVSTRFQGTDGVSLETEKWVYVLEKRLGFTCFFFSGLSDWNPERSMVVPEAFFDHPRVRRLQNKCYGTTIRGDEITNEIHQLRVRLKKHIYAFIEKYGIDMLIVENALAIPMHIPLGLAITEVVAESGIPTIGHHHDFFWERQRFLVNGVSDYINMAFPPPVMPMTHVTINTEARRTLSFRCGLSSIVIPNVFDYSSEPPGIDDYNRDIREDLGVAKDDVFILQPTRIIARKGIEHAVELVNRMGNKRVKLVVSHQARDEGKDYFKRIMDYADLLKVRLIIRPEIIGAVRGTAPDGSKIYSLWDLYPHADFVTYPSTYEGFGNAFLEAVYFRKPILVNRYSIYQQDIEPIGFDGVVMDTYITDEDVRQVKKVLKDAALRKKMTDTNFELAKRYFSYDIITITKMR